MKVLIFLINAGLVFGLQETLEYHYQYSGTIAVGIPELSLQQSAVAVEGRIIAQVRNDGSAIFKFADVKYAQVHGEQQCSVDDFSCKLNPHEEGYINDIVSEPFVAHLFDDSDYALDVASNEALFARNIRKAIVSTFKNELLNSNFENSCGPETVARRIRLGHVPHVFTVKEETIFGICDIHYTVHELPEYLADTKRHELQKHYKKDVQLDKSSPLTQKPSKTSKKYRKKTTTKNGKTNQPLTKFPQIVDKLWHVTRSVDFDHCEESVFLQHSSHGLRDRLDKGKYKWISGRSSVSEYLLRGSGGGFRIERAFIDGAIISNPNGPNAEAMQTRTKQILQLEGVYIIKNHLPEPQPKSKVATWMQEVISAAKAPEFSKRTPWMIYKDWDHPMRPYDAIMGEPMNADDLKFRSDFVKSTIKYLAKLLVDRDGQTLDEDAINRARVATMHIRDLEKEHLMDIFRAIMVEDYSPEETMGRKLLIDFLSASGTPPSIDILLQCLDDISVTEQLFVFMTMFHNIQSPQVIPKIMDHILQMELEYQPLTTSTALINLAVAVRRICIDPVAPSIFYGGKLFGDLDCKSETKKKLLPYLKDLAFNEDHANWKRILGVRAITELRSPFGMEILIPIVYGLKGRDMGLRHAAISGLQRYKLPNVQSIQKQAIRVLLDVLSNVGLHPRLRKGALHALVTYKLDTHVWNLLARRTWRDPSVEIASLIAETIRLFASVNSPFITDSNQAASFAVKQIRPLSPSIGLRNSEILLEIGHNLKEKTYSVFEASYFDRNGIEERFDSTIFNEVSRGGYNLKLLEGFAYLTKKIMKHEVLTFEDNTLKTIAARIFDKVQETVRAEPVLKHYGSYSYQQILPVDGEVYIKLFENMNLYLPFNDQTRSAIPYFDTVNLGAILMQLLSSVGYEVLVGKYINPVDNLFMVPTEVGLPSLTHISFPIVFGYHDIINANQAELSATSDFNMKAGCQVTMDASVFIPYEQHLIGSSVKSTRFFNAPARVSMEKYVLTIEPATDEKFTVESWKHTPSTFVVPLTFGKYGSKKKYEEKIIHEMTPYIKRRKFGLFEVSWEAAFSPFDLLNKEPLMGGSDIFFLVGSRTSKFWQYELTYDPAETLLRNITISFEIFTKPKNDNGQQTGQTYVQEPEQEPEQGPGQGPGQFPGDVEFGQNSNKQFQFQNFNEQTMKFTEFDAEQVGSGTTGGHMFADIDIDDTFIEKKNKILDYLKDDGTLISLRFDVHAKESHRCEIVAVYETDEVAKTRVKTDIKIAALKSSPAFGDKDFKVCTDVEIIGAKFHPLDTISDAFNSDIEREGKLEIRDQCKGDPIFKIKTHARVTEEAKEYYLKNYDRTCHEFDHPSNGIFPHELFVSSFTYNDVDVSIHFKKVEDKLYYPVLSAVTKVLSFIVSHQTFSDICKPASLSKEGLQMAFTKCLDCQKWSVSLLRSTKSEISHQKFNEVLNFVTRISSENEFIAHDGYDDCHKKCYIEEVKKYTVRDQVTTMDGLQYELPLTSCWTVAAMDCFSSDNWMVLVRKTGNSTYELKYIDKSRGIAVKIWNNLLRVNGELIDIIGDSETITDSKHRFVAEVTKKKDRYLVNLPTLVLGFMKYNHKSTKAKSNSYIENTKIIIQPHEMYRRRTCGLCGNFDGEPEIDMVGPRGCHYGDPDVFAASWSLNSDSSCDLYKAMAVRSPAEKHQKSCTNIWTQFAESSRTPEQGLSFSWVSPYKNEDYYCITQYPIAHCKPGFEPLSLFRSEVDLICYLKSNLPPVLQAHSASDHKFFYDPVDARPHKLIHGYTIELPEACVKQLK